MCDDVAEAKRIAFMGPERHKVVALDGTLIGKQGFITGGMSGNEAARASRWNDSTLEGLRKVGVAFSDRASAMSRGLCICPSCERHVFCRVAGMHSVTMSSIWQQQRGASIVGPYAAREAAIMLRTAGDVSWMELGY